MHQVFPPSVDILVTTGLPPKEVKGFCQETSDVSACHQTDLNVLANLGKMKRLKM